MENRTYETTARQMDTMPPGIPYIIGNEAAERFSFYGMRTILVIFMTKYLWLMGDKVGMTMSNAEAGEQFHIFVRNVYFFPIFGALLADLFFGKYRTILWLSFVYCAGHLALAVQILVAGDASASARPSRACPALTRSERPTIRPSST